MVHLGRERKEEIPERKKAKSPGVSRRREGTRKEKGVDVWGS